MIDIRALRDKQTADDEGRTISPDVAHGQVRWTLIENKGTDPLALIGRAEQVDEVKAISSTYACQNCCGDFFQESYISPSSVEIQVGGTATLHAFELHSDCYGYTYPVEQTGSWSSSNPSVASVSGGQVTSIGAGQTTITATWNSYTSVPSQCSGFNPGPIGGCCGSAAFFRSASATVRVVGVAPSVSISGPNAVPLGTDVNTIQLTASGNTTGGTYAWSTTSSRVTLTNTSSATVTVRSVSQSSSQNDVTINLAYSINAQTAHTLTTLTVQKPISLGFVTTTSQGTASNCATGSTGWERNIKWQVLDQFSQAMRYAGMRVTDAITLGTPNTCGASNPLTGTGFTDSKGQFPDRYSFCSPGCISANCQLSASQRWTVNGISLTSAINVFYTCTSITLNGQ